MPAAGFALSTIAVEGLSRSNPLRAARALALAARRGPARTVAARAAGARRGDGRRRLCRRPGRARGAEPANPARADRGRQPPGADQPRAGAGRAPGLPGLSARPVATALATWSPGARSPPPRTTAMAARERLGIASGETLRARVRRLARRALAEHRSARCLRGRRRSTCCTSAGAVTTRSCRARRCATGYDLREQLDVADFAEALRASDLVVARSGGSVFEIAAHGLPAILVPYPHASGDHQSANARWMTDAGAAIAIADARAERARAWRARSRRCSPTTSAWRRWRGRRARWPVRMRRGTSRGELLAQAGAMSASALERQAAALRGGGRRPG